MSLSDCPDEFNAKLESQYRDLISSSIFLYQWTRPDLGYTVTFLSRCLDKPGVKNLKLMQVPQRNSRVWRYEEINQTGTWKSEA